MAGECDEGDTKVVGDVLMICVDGRWVEHDDAVAADAAEEEGSDEGEAEST